MDREVEGGGVMDHFGLSDSDSRSIILRWRAGERGGRSEEDREERARGTEQNKKIEKPWEFSLSLSLAL